MPPKNNIALLTEGQAYIQRAKKARQDQVEEIKFDDAARSEWLTGFSKRKKAKVEEKRSRAKERDRAAHVEERRKARQELKERAKQNVKSVRAAMGLEVSDDEDDEGDDDENEEAPEAGPSKPTRHQDIEFEDDDQLATVTIVDDFDPSALPQVTHSGRESPAAEFSTEVPTEVKAKVKLPNLPASSKRAAQKIKRDKAAKEEKKKSRSMETKSERKFGRAMEAKRRVKKAGIAMERDGKSRGRSSSRGKQKGRK